MADPIRAADKRDRAIHSIASFLGFAEDDVDADKTMRQLDPKHDSLDDVELIMQIEDDFGIEIDDTEFQKLSGKTVGEYIKYIEGRV